MKKQTSPFAAALLSHLRLFLRSERGDDLIEYALLTASVAIASIAGLSLMTQAIQSTYASWDAGVQSQWEPPNP